MARGLKAPKTESIYARSIIEKSKLAKSRKLTKKALEEDSGALIFDNGIVKLVWTSDDVARELSCSIRHVRKLVAENKIPYLKIGRLVRFSPARLREWLQTGGTR